MKFKKSMIILILAVFLLSIAGVCASDVNDTAVASQEDAVTELIDENPITVEDTEPAVSAADEEILSDSVDDEIVGAENDLDELRATQSTYSGLSSEIGSGGNINLSYDYYTYDEGDSIEITVDDSVIDGNGAIIDMTGSNIQTFIVSASNVIIKNLTIKNANSARRGAAVNFEKTGAVENCTFVNNTASEIFRGGGAVYFNEQGTVTDCNFVNNSAAASLSEGGAVYFNEQGTVTNCNFVNNFATNSGGAISMNNGNVANCNFTNNSVKDGGAIFFFEEGSAINCNFVNNTASGSGGAIYFFDVGSVTYCNFTNNQAGTIGDDDEDSGFGGAVYFYDDADVKNCIFVNNNDTQFGGAVFIYGDGDVTNCSFTNNTAVMKRGGALCFMGNSYVTNCNFTDNYAGDYGGAVYYSSYGSGTVANCIFANNSASNYYGGGIFFSSEDCLVTNCIFTDNNAGKLAGAVCFYEKGAATNCTFVNNTAVSNGGAVCFFEEGSVTYCNFTNNKAENIGGAVCFYKNAEVTDCNFTDNSAKYGGAIYIAGSGNLINSNFTDNSAELYAGAAYIEKGIVENCNFNGNNAPDGGAIRIIGNVTVKNCSFNDNKATKGGAAFIYDSGLVTYCSFANNSAEDGGALFINGTAGVTNCNFTDNKVNGTDSYGGAIYWNGTDGSVSGCSFVNNSADDWGGAIYWSGTDGSVSDCSFVNNSADMGGAIKWQRNNGSVSRCSFVNNSAGYSGGAIWWTTYNGVVSGCVFMNNSVDNITNKGAIYFSNGRFFSIDLGRNLTIKDNIFLNNNDTAINFVRTDNTSNANYNWFGNNATNYDIEPVTTNAGTTTWLFLNATADPNWIYIPDSSEIIFKLYAYGPDGVSEYDNGRLGDVNLTLTPTKGRVNTTRAKLGEAVEYTPESMGIANITATIEDAAYTITLTITDGTTFSDLNRLINGNNNSTIILDRDYTYNPDIDYDFKDGIVINRAMTIIGNNHTIDAAGQARIFKVQASGVTIENMTFENAKANGGSGGAIFWSGANGKISDCAFVNNSADEWGGAIIWFEANNGAVSGCVFVNNSCSDNTGGSTIEWHESDDGVVCDCVFVNNRDSDASGVVYWMGNRGNVSGCYFANNSANFGIVYLLGGSDFSVNNNIFLNNDADAIYSLNRISTSNADYNWFGQNATNYNTTPSFHRMPINSWLFLNATADPDLISLYGSSDILFKLYSYDSTEISEYDNSRLKEVNLTLTPTNGRINTTQTGLDESVHYIPEAGGIGMLTAAIEDASYTISLHISDGTTFFDLNTTINGNDNDTIVLDKDFTYNPTFDYDLNDGIVINRSMTIIGNGHILNATGLARIFDIQADDVTIENITFVNAKVSRDGGAVYWNGANGNVSDCIFANNSANSAGAIYWNGANGNVSDCIFVNNSATYAGAIYCDGESSVVCDCDFVNNSAYSSGAVDWMAREGVVSGCSFVNNSAESTGGAIYWTGADSKVSDCIFANNNADSGGAIIWDGLSGAVSGCIFVNNSADNAGAIRWRNNDGGVVSGCEFVNNSAGDSIIYYANNYYGTNLLINDNVFLNNDGVAIYFEASESSSNADYNWFGNNATDYDIEPVTHNVEINAWLFLNATADPASISASESSDILFKLYSYDSTGVSDYDNSKLPVVNLTVTANNGDVDKDVIALGDSVVYTPDSVGDASVTASIENAEYTIALDVVKSDSVLSGDDLVMAYKDGSAWNVTLTDVDGNAISGKIVKIGININGLDKVYSCVTDSDGVASLPINLVSGTYAVNATFEGDDDYDDSFTNATVTVNRAVAILTSDNLEMSYKDGSSWIVALTDTNGNAITGVRVAIGVSGKVYQIKTDDEGNAKLPINLPSGTYTVNASFIDSRYEAELITATIIVDKAVPVLSADDLVMNYKDGSAWNVTLADANGNFMADTYVKLTIAGKTYTRKTNADGVVSLPINLPVGNYTVSALFSGSSNLGVVEINRTVVVNPPVYNLVANDINMTYQDGTNYTVQITDAQGNPVAQAGVVIKVTICGKSYNLKTNADGISSLPINLKAGTYEITAEYNGKQITNKIVINKP